MPGSGLRRGTCRCGWESSDNVKGETVKAEYEEHIVLNEGPRPSWAIDRTDSYLAVGAQLRTRDGTVCGNAVVVEYPSLCNFVRCAKVITDAGAVMFLNEEELIELFHRPSFVMDARKAPGVMLNSLIVAVDQAVPDSESGGWILVSIGADRRLLIHDAGSGEPPEWMKEKTK